jgi:hypothetical protein
MPKSRSEINAEAARKRAILVNYLQPGDLLTHTRCMDALSEHRFVRWTDDGLWLIGNATYDTVRYGNEVSRKADDISPYNVTHVNRCHIDTIDEFPPEHKA